MKHAIVQIDGMIECTPPNDELYEFKGIFSHGKDNKKAPLDVNNTMWQNTVLASQSEVYGLVIFTGVETRSNMSSKIPRSKLGLLDEECNSLAKGLFCMMLFLSLIIVALDKFVGSWYFKYFRCLLLLCNIIPISMRINLDFAKLFYAGQINNDGYIKGTMVRNSNIPEELGRI